jgi:hypothetical protein
VSIVSVVLHKGTSKKRNAGHRAMIVCSLIIADLKKRSLSVYPTSKSYQSRYEDFLITAAPPEYIFTY